MLLTFIVTIGSASACSSPPLASPPLGYSTWQWNPGTHWGKQQGQYDAVNESTCREQADAMVAKGLVKAGYTVFVVDEPCFAGRDASGALVANSTTWPSGFAAFGGEQGGQTEGTASFGGAEVELLAPGASGGST